MFIRFKQDKKKKYVFLHDVSAGYSVFASNLDETRALKMYLHDSVYLFIVPIDEPEFRLTVVDLMPYEVLDPEAFIDVFDVQSRTVGSIEYTTALGVLEKLHATGICESLVEISA